MNGHPLPNLRLLLTSTPTGEPQQDPYEGNGQEETIRPIVGLLIGSCSVIFSVTIIVLYSKFCSSNAPIHSHSSAAPGNAAGEGSRRVSGIDKAVIQSLPFFRFSDFKGSREGLECAVCLSRFQDSDIVRLLPRCKHVFHIDCLDRWLYSHSSCPLCRTRVDADDVAFFNFSLSSRRLFQSIAGRPMPAESELELYVEREHAEGGGKLAAGDKVEPTPAAALHTLKHRVIVSDAVFRSRWSDFNSADMMSLESEMLQMMSSKRFPATSAPAEQPELVAPGHGVSTIRDVPHKQNPDGVNFPTAYSIDNRYSSDEISALISPASRSISDITALMRYAPAGINGVEEKVRRLWLPIARRTVEWFTGERGRFALRNSSLDPTYNV
ncbi:Putative RING-H2 finger protein ATL12 [Apostasia shenzhenica]|uniref:RING-type E3 ubiquitin transferase n=1 Tax=Apostasia shenzhenica TaxID=1088818 RepID=A0A2H9ZZM3_9ASPA|nr:Putative RING-H2 finger protein ATL12 [Apostasia shenzhenica]